MLYFCNNVSIIYGDFMGERLLYFANASEITAEMAKKCRDCSLREGGLMSDMLYEARKEPHSFAKVAIIVDKSQKILGWGACFTNTYGYMPEMMVYVRSKCRRKGYGTQIINKILSKSPKNQQIRVYRPENDPNNRFYSENFDNSRLKT